MFCLVTQKFCVIVSFYFLEHGEKQETREAKINRLRISIFRDEKNDPCQPKLASRCCVTYNTWRWFNVETFVLVDAFLEIIWHNY